MSERIPRAPAIFFGHGSPMNALGGPYGPIWRALGASFPKPKAILMVSAHWYVPETAVTAMAQPRTIYDFYGFPPALYEVAYPATGDAWLAQRVADLLGPLPVRADHDWGLDHGTWSVLVHAFPDADVPVVQLAIDGNQPPAFHYELGRRLAALRDEGVLIAGSGDVVHNLRAMRRDGSNDPFDWAERFNAEVRRRVETHDHQGLIDIADHADSFSADAQLSIPTDEHWLPLLYVLGARGEDEAAQIFTDVIELGSVSMMGVGFGIGDAIPGVGLATPAS
jgi:4,5-DOPA dioxygenase extradiol